MDSKSALMLGAAAAALAGGPALAAPPPSQSNAVPVVATYAELLEPIPNAVERLKLADAEAAARPPQLIEVQFDPHHHHHHHHHHDRAWYQQNGYIWANGGWILRPPPRPHHHHHNGWWYRHNGYVWNGNAWVRPHHHHHHHNHY
jgi:hypothetical protein